MSQIKLTRGPQGELITPFAAEVEKRADSMAWAKGTSRAGCYAEAFNAIMQEQPDLSAQHQRLMAGDTDPRVRAALPQAEQFAFAELARVERLSARPVTAPKLPITAAEQFLALVDAKVASRPREQVDRYSQAYLEAGKERPDLARAYQNRAVEEEPEEFFTQPDYEYPDMEDLKAKARELMRAIAKANGYEFDEAEFNLAFTDADAVKAFMKRFQTQVVAERIAPGGGGKVVPVTVAEQGYSHSFRSGLQTYSLAELQAPIEAGTLTHSEMVAVSSALDKITGNALEPLLANLTPEEAVELRQWLEQRRPKGAPVLQNPAMAPSKHSDPPRVERFAYGEAYGTLQSVLAGGPIKILPMGKFHRDSRVLNITEQDMRAIEANAAKGLPNFRIPVNVEHKGELGKVGTLKAIRYMPEGPDGAGLYGSVDWSDVGRQLITGQKFDAVSVEIVWDKNEGATFQDPKTGTHVGSGVVTGLALTNSPFFGHEHVALFAKGK